MGIFSTHPNLTDQERASIAQTRLRRAERNYAKAESELIEARRAVREASSGSAYEAAMRAQEQRR